LIAEDESLMREFVTQVLTDAGYVTARAVDGDDAIECAKRSRPFDLLLTDLVMPRVRGTELARRLRLKQPTLKVLYFTGYSDQLFKEKGELWDAEALLEKPSTIEGLLEAVSQLLDGHVPPAARDSATSSESAVALLRRVKAEFREMPGLRLTEAQARRLWGLDVVQCASLLARLRAIGFIFQTRDGAFMKVEG